ATWPTSSNSQAIISPRWPRSWASIARPCTAWRRNTSSRPSPTQREGCNLCVVRDWQFYATVPQDGIAATQTRPLCPPCLSSFNTERTECLRDLRVKAFLAQGGHRATLARREIFVARDRN